VSPDENEQVSVPVSQVPPRKLGHTVAPFDMVIEIVVVGSAA
jgi:hypothetical protein